MANIADAAGVAERTDALGAVGGKAAVLLELLAAGFDVPPFVVIPADEIGRDGLTPAGRARLGDALRDGADRTRLGLAARDGAGLGDGPFAVRSSARGEDGAAASHAGQFETRLCVAADELEAAILAVWRSGDNAHVAAYRERIGATADSARHQGEGVAGRSGHPAVIVQRMIAPRAAGVLFTADPVSGRRDKMPVSAVAGLADRLVAGAVDGTAYLLPRVGPIAAGPAPSEAPGRGPDGSLTAADPARPTPEGRLSAAEPACPAADGPLTDTDLARLRDLALAVEAHYGTPQDIEFAFGDDRLWLLQARPITTLPRAIPDPRRLILDNSNIVESYPGLVTPLTFSFAVTVYAEVYRRFLALLGVPAATIAAHRAMLDNMLARYEGRVYYNLIEWYRALALLPGFRLNRAHMETMMGVGEPLPADIADALAPPPAKGFAKAAEWLRVAGSAGRLAIEALILPRTIRRFQKRLDAALGTPAAALAGMPLSALAAHYRAIEAELLERWDAPLVNDFLCMIAFGASRKLMQRWAGEPGLMLHNDIMIGQGDIVSAEPAQRIRRMGAAIAGDADLIARFSRGDRAAARDPRIAAEFAAYLDRFGDRCTAELKLESTPLGDDPAPLLKAIAAAAARSGAPAPRQGGDPGARLAALFAGRPLRRIAARALVGTAKRRVRDRENLRFERTRVFGHARRVFLAIGREFCKLGLIDDPRDVLMLTVGEVLGAIEGAAATADLRGLVRVRAAEMAAAAALPDPPERLEFAGSLAAHLGAPAAARAAWASGAAGESGAAAGSGALEDGAARDGAVPGGVSGSGRHPGHGVPGGGVAATGIADAAGAGAAQPDARRTGIGCSAGRVRGVARIIADPAAQSLASGEIMVARHTDPGWIALFASAAAIVVERGSLLSHSAIVARELGIPCVVGLKGAMAWIADGETIEVDGAAGVVTRIGPAA